MKKRLVLKTYVDRDADWDRKTEVDALCEAARTAGYEIDEATAEAAWERWSYAMSATWLSGPPSGDEGEYLEALLWACKAV